MDAFLRDFYNAASGKEKSTAHVIMYGVMSCYSPSHSCENEKFDEQATGRSFVYMGMLLL